MALRFGVNLSGFCRKGYRNFHVGVPNFRIVQFVLSDIGEGIKEVTVRDWFVKVGDKVRQFDDICLVESDKAAVNITSRFDGVITKIYHEEGALALVGQPLVDIDAESEETVDAETSRDPTIPSTTTYFEEEAQRLGGVTQQGKATAASTTPFNHEDVIHSIDSPEHKSLATPAVRRIAKEHKVALSEVKGSGKGGRIMKEDILEHLDKRAPTHVSSKSKTVRPPATGLSSDGKVPITGIKKAMAKAMAASHSIPSFGYCDELDVTKLVALRKEIKSQLAKDGVNVTYMPFFIKALSNSLDSFPELNAHVDAECENVTIKSDHNIGLAIDTPHGLLVPNIKQVQSKSVLEISSELGKLMQKATDRTLSVHDLSGGTITISNIGIIGGTYVRPLINPPEVAIVGIGRFSKRPVFDSEDNIVAAHTCNASWSADHRVIDGATLARFSELWKHYVENPLKLLLDS